MNLASFLPWLVVVHVLSVLGFVALHGPSMVAAFQLRNERDPARVRGVLDQSGISIGAMYLFLALLVLSGIAAGIAGGYFTSGQLWIWTAIVVLIVVIGGMYGLATRHFIALREAAGSTSRDDREIGRTGTGVADEARLAELLASPRPLAVAAVGIVGLAIIAWLMVMKPF
ncbi:MAG: hypothetical protein ACJ77N_06750 [Chloroflexota bacterium]|jgi:hypothetical protein